MEIEDDNLPNEQAADSAPAETENQSEAETEGEQPEEEAKTETDGEPEEGSDEDDGDDEEPEKPKRAPRSHRYARRIERLEAENAALRSRQPSGSLTDDQLASELERRIGKPPKEEDFKGDYISFERELNAYNVDKRISTREIRNEATQREAKEAERRAELAEAHLERIEEFKEKASDFEEVIRAAGKADLKASPVVESLLLESEKSAHLLYYLAKNPGDLDKLNRMSPLAAAREVGRIEAQLSLPQPNKQTNAPKPFARPKGGGGAPPFDPNKTNDMEAYVKWSRKGYAERQGRAKG